MRFTPSSRDQFDLRSANVQVRSVVDRNVRFVAQDILGTESLSKELFREDIRPVKFFLELFLIVPSSIKLGTRVQTAEIRMTADMVPVCMGDEDGC